MRGVTGDGRGFGSGVRRAKDPERVSVAQRGKRGGWNFLMCCQTGS